MADNIPTEVRCPHCEGVVPPDWVLNVCPQCGRSVALAELRRAAVAVADTPTEEPPPTSHGRDAHTTYADESEPAEASEPFLSDLPFDVEPSLASETLPPPTRPCVYHPNVESAQFCPMCGKTYCDDCLVEFRGRKICGACKDAEVAALQRQGGSQAPMTGLILGIIGAAGGALCCLLGVCSIIGVVMGYQSLREIKEGKLPRAARPTALAAIAVGWVGIVLLGLNIFVRVLIVGVNAWTSR